MASVQSEGVVAPEPGSARTLKTLPEVLSALSTLQSKETALASSLSALLEAREPLQTSLARLASLSQTVEALKDESGAISSSVAITAHTAERVRGKVQALDEEMRRVRESGERVQQVMELKTSLSSLKAAMDSQDWEAATRHCARAMAVPEHIISGPFAESAVPTKDFHLPPTETLTNARAHLLDVFRKNFERAASTKDSAGITRFFKLFPLVGWEKEGLEAYSDFVIDLVRGRPQPSGKISSPAHFVTALTSLFESIAMIVSQHQPIIEKYYGNGKMYDVIKKLIIECDRVVKSLVSSWEEERQASRKLQDASNAVFTSSTAPVAAKRGVSQPVAEDAADPREIDQFLSELAAMVGRWSLFRRFMYDRLRDDILDSPPASTVALEPQHSAAPSSPIQTSAAASFPPQPLAPSTLQPSDVAALLENSTSRAIFHSLLTTYYIPLETWYLRSIIHKSHRLSTLDASAMPPQHTLPEDVFYILKGVLGRCISTGVLGGSTAGSGTESSAITGGNASGGLERMCTVVREVMERDYAGVIKAQLEDVYSGKGPGGVGAGGRGGEKAERESRTTFMILLNDLSISGSHAEKLIRGIISSGLIEQSFLDSEDEPVRTTLNRLLSIVTTFKSIVNAGIEQLFNQLTRPKLRQFIADVYKDVSYKLDQDAYTAAEYNDIVRKRFIKLWYSLLDGFKETFTDSNYHAFFLLTVEILARHWEKHILSMRFSELGAIRFDRDLRGVSAYLGSQAEFADAREKFQRLQQISTLLNLDEEEDPDEFYSGSGIVWRLSANDAKTVVGLRIS